MNNGSLFYITASASYKDRISDVITDLAGLGFRNIELSGGTRYYDGVEEDVLALGKKYGINFLVHNYFPPSPVGFVMNIASRDKTLLENTLRHIEIAMALAGKLDCGLYTLHPGFNTSLLNEEDRRFFESPKGNDAPDSGTKEDFYKGVGALKTMAEKRRIRVGIENFFPFFISTRAFMESGADLTEFLDRYRNEPAIGLLLDLGHLNVAANTLGFDKFALIEKVLGEYRDKLFEVHVSENDGSRDNHQVSTANSWQIKLIRENKERLSGVPIVFEWRNSSNSETYKRYRELENLFKA